MTELATAKATIGKLASALRQIKSKSEAQAAELVASNDRVAKLATALRQTRDKAVAGAATAAAAAPPPVSASSGPSGAEKKVRALAVALKKSRQATEMCTRERGTSRQPQDRNASNGDSAQHP